MRYRGAIAILVGAAVVFLCEWTGLLGLADHLLYDRMVRLTPARMAAPSDLLLVEATAEESFRDDACWLPVLRTLEAMKPQSIGFTFLPAAVSGAFYEAANANGITWFGRPIAPRPSSAGSSEWEYDPLPAAAGRTLRTAALFRPPLEEGIARRMSATGRVDGQPAEGIEYALARTRSSFVPPVETSNGFLVNFNGKLTEMPRVPLARVLEQGLVPAMVEGRTVLVGIRAINGGTGLATPISGHTPETAAMDDLGYRGFALATLLEGSAVRELPMTVNLGAAVLALVLGLFLYQQVGGRSAFWIMATLSVLILGTAWSLLSYGSVWPPCAAPLLANVLIYSLVFRIRQEVQEQQVQQLDYRVHTRISERFFPKGFFVTEDHWAQVAAMVSQMLDLRRTIFLERVEGDHRVREVKSLNCSLADIHEMRRDYERTPYSTAIEAGGPIRIEERIYLKTDGTPETQYLTPLSFGGQIMGFWAVGIAPGSEGDPAIFNQAIRDFAQNIAELLYRRRQWQATQANQPGLVTHCLRLAGESAAVRELTQSFNLIDRRMTVMSQTFDRLSTATVLYDVFGNVMQINERMLELLRTCNLQAFDLTAADLGAALTGIDTATMRRNLWSLAMERRPLSFSASVPGQTGMFLLLAHPVTDEEQDWAAGEARPFQLLGILLELVDASAFRREYEVRRKLMETIGRRLRELAAGMREDDSAAKNSGSPSLAGRSGDLSTLMEALECQPASLPVDLAAVLDTAIHEVLPAYRERSLDVQLDLPKHHCLIRGDEMGAKRTLEAMLHYLAADAVENSALAVSLTEEEGLACIVMSNTGFGVPDAVFQQGLAGMEAHVSNELGRLRNAAQWAKEWQGTMYGRSEVGTGTRLELQLRLFV